MRKIAAVLVMASLLAGCAGMGAPSAAAPTVAAPTEAPSAATPTSAASAAAPTDGPGVSSPPTTAPTAGPTPRACLPDPISLADLIAYDDPAGPLTEKFPPIAGPYGEKALACLGGASITVKGFVAGPEGIGGITAFSYTPAWFFTGWWVQPTAELLDPGLPQYGVGPWLAMAIPTTVGDCWTGDWTTAAACPFSKHVGKWVTITGHYDDAAAKDCKVMGKSPAIGPAPTTKQMVQICRSTFVLESVAPAS